MGACSCGTPISLNAPIKPPPAAPIPRPVSSVTKAPPATMGPTPGITRATRPAIRPTPPPNEAPDAAAAPVLVDASFAFSRYSLWRLASLPAITLMSSPGIPRFFRSRSVRSASTSDVNTPTIVLMQSYLPISGCTARANGAIDTVSSNQENCFMRNTVLVCVFFSACCAYGQITAEQTTAEFEVASIKQLDRSLAPGQLDLSF